MNNKTISEILKDITQEYSTDKCNKMVAHLLTKCTVKEVCENAHIIAAETTYGKPFMQSFILSNDIPLSDLDGITSRVNTMKSKIGEGYDELVGCLNELLEIVDVKRSNTTNFLNELILESKYTYRKDIVSESTYLGNNTITDEFSLIIDNIIVPKNKDSKELEKLSNKIVKILEVADGVDMVRILGFVTSTVIYTSLVLVPSIAIASLISLPITMVNRLSRRVNKLVLGKSLEIALNQELRKVNKAIKLADKKDAKYLKDYKESLETALNNLKVEISLESVIANNFCDDDYTKQLIISNDLLEESFINFSMGNNSLDEDINLFNQMISISNLQDIVQEKAVGKIRKGINKGVNKASKTARKVSTSVKKSKEVGKTIKNHKERAENKINDTASNVVNDVKDKYRESARDDIIENKTKVKLTKLIRNGILVGGAYAVNPALAAIGTLTAYGLKKHVSEKERKKIIDELEEELEIVNEKIEDAKGDENKSKKYELMRIRNKLEKDIKRVRYRLKSSDRGL